MFGFFIFFIDLRVYVFVIEKVLLFIIVVLLKYFEVWNSNFFSFFFYWNCLVIIL